MRSTTSGRFSILHQGFGATRDLPLAAPSPGPPAWQKRPPGPLICHGWGRPGLELGSCSCGSGGKEQGNGPIGFARSRPSRLSVRPSCGPPIGFCVDTAMQCPSMYGTYITLHYIAYVPCEATAGSWREQHAWPRCLPQHNTFLLSAAVVYIYDVKDRETVQAKNNIPLINN